MRQLPPSSCTRVLAPLRPRIVPTLCATSLSLVLLVGPPVCGATPSAVIAQDGASTAQQISHVGKQLMAAADSVGAAQKAVDAATNELAAAQSTLAEAKAQYQSALEREAAARSEAKAAQADIAKQQVELGHTAQDVATTHRQVDQVARQVYMNGGEVPGEIEILLQSQTPAEFATQLQVIKRSARGNNDALQRLLAAQREQRAALAKLAQAEKVLSDSQTAAEQQAAAAAEANDRAAAASTQIESVVQSRTQKLEVVSQQRREVARLYQQMLIEQREELLAAAREQREAELAAARREAAAAKRAAAEKKAARDAAREAAKKAQSPVKPTASPSPKPVSKPTTAPKPTPKPPAKKKPANPGSGGYVTTIGTGRSARSAVAWALGMVGSGWDYHNQCLRFVDDAYNVSHSRQPTAISQYYRALNAGYAHPGSRNIPIGAQVFWSTSNPARHIAIYAGGGMVISTDAANGAVGFVPMSTLDRWGPYLGWAAPYYP